MSLYTMQGFACVARLSRFYYISTGRQPDPNTQVGWALQLGAGHCSYSSCCLLVLELYAILAIA
jgi:hypothetical protein